MNLERLRIMMVEPETVLAEITAFRLELLGYSVEVVPSAEEALQKLAAYDPDLVLTDTVLPGLDAAAFIERLSTDEASSDLPILVLSIDADLDRVQNLYRVGARDFLVVPFHPHVMEEKVARLLLQAKERRTQRAARGEAVESH